MVIKKKSLIGAATDKKKAPDDGSGKNAANLAPAKEKKLAVAKVATAKLSTARLLTLRKLH
jgi:hypothetical protein